MLTPVSADKLVCVIGFAGVFVGEHVRKQVAAAYSHVLADSYVYDTAHYISSKNNCLLSTNIASPIPLKVILHGTIIRNNNCWRNTVFQCWNNVVTIQNNVVTLCCAKNCHCESSRVNISSKQVYCLLPIFIILFNPLPSLKIVNSMDLAPFLLLPSYQIHISWFLY